MKDSLKEPKLTYALDSSEKMVHVSSVERGLSCNCRCPKCKEPLEAKLGYGGRQPHFAHKKDSDCQGFYMTALHKLAEQIIEEEKAVMAPAYKEIGRGKLSFSQVEVEQRVERKDLQPDLVGITEDGSRWIIEIRNTHEVDEAKRAKLIESNITCLEIDVREQTLENLKSFILESAENREWINNPIYDNLLADLQRIRITIVENYISDKNEFVLPEVDEFGWKNIFANEVRLIKEYYGGLLHRLRIKASDGEEYTMNIGSHEVLCQRHLSSKDTHELFVYTDKISIEQNDHIKGIEICRIYNHSNKKPISIKRSDSKEYPVLRLPTSPIKNDAIEDYIYDYNPELLSDFQRQLLNDNDFVNSRGETISILMCEQCKHYPVLIVLCQKDGIKSYYIYGVRVKNGKFVFAEINDYTNQNYAIKYYRFLRVSKDWNPNNNYILDYNPFEHESSSGQQGQVTVSLLKRKENSYLNQVSDYNDRGTIAIRDTASKGQTTVANRDTSSQYKALP